MQFRDKKYFNEVKLTPKNIEQTGDNKTTLVLLPGLDGTEIFFAPLLRYLPDWIEPVMINYPTSGSNSYEDLLPVVIKKVENIKSFIILGWSFGGPLALMVASYSSSQVTGIILCGSFVTPPRPRLVPFRFAISAPLIAFVRALRRTRLLIPGYATSEFRCAKAMTWQRVNSSVLASRLRAVLSVDARSHLDQWKSRLMYLSSTQDEVVSRESLNEVLAIAPQTQLAEIEGKHFALFTNPHQSAAYIKKFLLAQN